MAETIKHFYSNLDEPSAFTGVKKLSKASKATLKETREWLSNERSYTLYKPTRKPKKYRKYKTPFFGYQIQVDLLQMKPYRGYVYILTIIDIFSRYLWAIPLKNKKPAGIVSAYEDLFKEIIPFYVQSDRCTEFYNSSLQNL